MNARDSKKIRLAIEEKGIKKLLHFTNCMNLESILKNGLLSREKLDLEFMHYEYNDTLRYDGCLNTISVSISFPNYKMLWVLMNKQPTIDWAIIVINPKVAYEQRCAFCVDNAGSATEFAQEIDKRKTFTAFEKCFKDYPAKPPRAEMRLPDRDTTNPQSEILVFDKIELSDIIAVLFIDQQTKEHYEDCCSNKKTAVCKHLFGFRKDYEYWR